MQVDPEYLREHYAALSDEALFEIDRDELVETARQCYDYEVGQRQREQPAFEPEEQTHAPVVDGETPDWADEAAEVFGVTAFPGTTPEAAVDARNVLKAAGIPAFLDLHEDPEDKSPAPDFRHRWRVMVPGKLNLQAASILDRDIFNSEFEAEWKTHLETLSDDELRAVNPKQAFCGLFDRIERVTRAYKEEVAKRG